MISTEMHAKARNRMGGKSGTITLHTTHTHTSRHVLMFLNHLFFFFFLLKIVLGPEILRIISIFHFECAQMMEPKSLPCFGVFFVQFYFFPFLFQFLRIT